jgi:glycosyltransferase involved in cell wall biosynthesis
MTEPLRVLTVIHGFHPLRGGAETAALEIASRVAVAGFVPVVLTAGFGRAPREEWIRGIRVVRAPVPSRRPGPAGPASMLAFAASAFPAARRLAGASDIVHAHFTIPAGLLALLLRRTGKRPYLVTLPGSDVPGYSERPYSRLYGLTRPLVRAVWRGASQIVAVSEDLKRSALRIDPGASVEVIPSGVDAKRFAPPPDGERTAGRILLVGRLMRLKGQSVFLRALARVRKQWDGHLLAQIVGGGSDLENLRETSSRLGLSDIVEMPGFVGDEGLPGRYAQAALFVMPSLNDAAPLAILEAMASGLPVVASAVGGIPEALPAGGALLVPPGDEEALAGAILQLLSDPARAAAMGRENRTAATRYDWDVIAGRYGRLYEQAAAGRSDG